jgi:hypothetical protein
MKRNMKIILLITSIIIIGILVFWFNIRVPNKDEPQRLNNIPKSAIWKGSVDEGFWFELVKIDTVKKIYRIRIYNDYKGGLVADADFIKQTNCKVDYPLNNDIINEIIYFEFDKIEMKKDCNLKMLKPIYDGSLKEER